MRVKKRQQVYGLVYGAAAFLAGIVVTAYFIDPGIVEDANLMTVAGWTYLSANGMDISALGGIFGAVNIVDQFPELQPLRSLPFLLIVAASMMANQTIGRTRRGKHILYNSLSVNLGYVAAGALTVLVTNARPEVAGIAGVGLVAGLALFIGSTLVQRLTGGLPIIGIVSIGGLFAIGLLALASGLAIVRPFIPVLGVSVAASIFGAVLNYTARNAPT